MPAKNTKYDESSIVFLEGLEAVRLRPGMYIGDTGQKGFTHLLRELIDNSVDEADAGHCNKIKITLHEDTSIEVEDNGRGIPSGNIKSSDGTEKNALSSIFTELHSGGKFGGEKSGYVTSGGLHGVGVSVVNAMSKSVEVEVKRDNQIYRIDFYKQEPGHWNESKKYFTADEYPKIRKQKSAATYTKIRYIPDYDLFKEDVAIDAEELKNDLSKLSCLLPCVKFQLTDKRNGQDETFTAESKNGMVDILDALGNKDSAITKPIRVSEDSSFVERKSKDGGTIEVTRPVHVEAAFRWEDSHTEPKIITYVNTIETEGGGTHHAAFVEAIVRAANKHLFAGGKAEQVKKKAGKQSATREQILEGLVGVVRVKFPEPQFEGQTKHRLGTQEIRSIAYKAISASFIKWIEKGTKAEVNRLRQKIISAFEAAEASRMALERARSKTKDNGNALKLPAKLADCGTPGPDAELMIVEGESAAGPAKMGRDAETIAVLPLRGKVLNAMKVSTAQAHKNAEVSAIIDTVGAGTEENCEPDDARYGKIVILCDADVDGDHIQCLLLTLFYKFMKPLLEAGMIYTACPPLFTARDKAGKLWKAYSDKERKALEKKAGKGLVWKRFKGLGEMNVDELAEFALNPATRILERVSIANAKDAEKKVMLCMGTDASARKDFIAASGI